MLNFVWELAVREGSYLEVSHSCIKLVIESLRTLRPIDCCITALEEETKTKSEWCNRLRKNVGFKLISR